MTDPRRGPDTVNPVEPDPAPLDGEVQDRALIPNLERRHRPRGSTQRTVSRAHRWAAALSRGAQVVAGALVLATGIAALYVVGRRAVADHAVTVIDWGFFALGALMLGAGFGVVIGTPFWRSLGNIAGVADKVLDSIRGK